MTLVRLAFGTFVLVCLTIGDVRVAQQHGIAAALGVAVALVLIFAAWGRRP